MALRTHLGGDDPSTGAGPRPGRLWFAASVAAATSLAVTTATAGLLTWRYRPSFERDGLVERGTSTLSAVHEASLAMALVATVVWAALTVADGRRRGASPSATAMRAVLVPVLVVVAVVAWGAVQWDQLALWGVTVGGGQRGLWYPAFSGEVRFLLIDGAEVSPAAYAPWLLAHLLAPVAALAALTLSFTRRSG